MKRSTAFMTLAWLVLIVGCASEPTAPAPVISRLAAGLSLPAFDRAEAPTTNTVVVTPLTLNGACQTLAAPFACSTAFPSGWLFYDDKNDAGDPTLGSFVAGPSVPTYGIGSAKISVTGTQRRSLVTYQFAGTPLASITTLKFRTFNPSAGNGGSSSRSAYLNFNVDFTGSDSWQRRLVFVPSQNGTVLPNTWKEWDAINGGAALWSYSGPTWPGSSTLSTPGTTLRSWAQILALYPHIRIRVTDAHMGLRVGEPYTDGYTENIDSFTFGTAAATTIFDFEPYAIASSKSDCKDGGWKNVRQADGSVFKNQGACESYVEKQKEKDDNGEGSDH